MKANIFIRIFLLPSLALMAACAEEEPCDEGVATTLHASIEQPSVTKTALSGPASGLYKTLWGENDKIAVYANGGTAGAEFSLTNGAGTNNGEFKGNIPSGSRIAVYPYSICSEASGNTIKVVLPEEQQYKPGNIPDNAYPMVASPSESTLRFKNLCSVLKISMTGDLTINSILFLANSTDVMVSGNASIDAENTALTMSSDAGSRLVLKCDGVKLSGTASDFFLVVPSQTYTGGFSLTIDTDKGKVLKTIQSDVTLKRSELYRISPFECKIDEDNNNIIFEDTHFKAYMIANFDKDKDGEISFDEALSVIKIAVCTDTIASLAGIEHMTNLTYLSCNGSHVWNSTTAKYEDGGILKNLDISKNSKLTTLYCNYNQLTSLDVSQNTKLTTLLCSSNQLTSLDVSKNTELSTLHCNYNQLTSLDVTNNTSLSTLYCEGIDLDGIDIQNNPLLSILGADENRLSTIDLTNNPKLSYVSLTSNKLTTIDVSKNSELQYFYVGYNGLTSIDVSRNPELMFIHCQNNQLTSIDVSNNSKLIGLGCYNNSISELDVTKNTKLTSLDFENNQISSIDLKNCPDIKYLYCSDNKLKSLKVNSCPKITDLWVHNNSIEVLDISKLTDLERFYSAPNQLLKTLYVYSGQIDQLKDKSIPSTTNIVVGSEPDNDEVFSVTPSLFNIDGKEQDITMAVTASMDYKLDSTPDWISQKSVESGKHTFTVTANTASSPRSGDIVFRNVNNSLLTVTVKQGIQAYTSTDYSQDGLVTKIHSATVGKGIDVVFVGDAFADKDQEVFNKYVELGKEAFFTEEPFKSTKDRFNIYRIGSVSKNGIISQEGGDTKFSVIFKGGTLISGNSDAIFSFVQNMLPSVDLRKTIIFVIINKAKYAGTCLMYNTNRAICYVPLGNDETDFSQVLRHEGCGHGFGKLADEYFYTSNGTIPDNEITKLKRWQSYAYGFYENVDLTSDPNTIAWSNFLSDSRYSGNIGVYEGGYTYPNGIYRPTEYSIMRYNTGGFNAPSREAIYKKIMKFSEGDAWTFNYEEFVEFDAPARSAEAVTRAAAQSASIDKANFIPLAPPVMILVDE